MITDDGLVPLTAEDLKAHRSYKKSNSGTDGCNSDTEESDSDTDNSLDETLIDDAEASAHNSPKQTERRVLRNTARNQAFQVNCPIGEDVWKDIDRLVIEDNVAEDQSMQFNYGMSFDMALAFMDRHQANTGNNRTLEKKI
jgi:hypothetical protein